jgi:chromosome partitioning protein
VRILAVCNSKGGVGKTQSAVHLAVGLARAGGYRVLLVDVDRQSNASRWLLPGHSHDMPGLPQAMLRGGAPRAEELHQVPSVPGLTVLPATRALAEVEAALPGRISQETTLRRVLAPLADAFDVAILDCPPNLSGFTLNSLAAAQHALVPLESDVFSTDGLAELMLTVANVRGLLNPALEVLGLLHFKVDARTTLARDTRAALRKAHGTLLMTSEVRTSQAVRDLPRHGRTAWDAGADERGAEDWPEVLAEVVERLAGPRAEVANG